jgi:hypothetical protein
LALALPSLADVEDGGGDSASDYSASSGSRIGADVYDDLGSHSSSDSDVVDEDLKDKLKRAHRKVCFSFFFKFACFRPISNLK